MRHMSFAVVYALGVLASAHSLSAQATGDTTTASFRKGEWGVGFTFQQTVTEAGVLRFSTPTRAWVFDASASINGQSSTGGNAGDQTSRSIDIGGRFGPRWYHAVTGHVARTLGFGVSGSYSSNHLTTGSGQSTFWSAGGYGEVGMQYMVRRYLGLGWRGSVTAWRGESNTSQQTLPGLTASQRYINYRVGLDPVQITGAFYF